MNAVFWTVAVLVFCAGQARAAAGGSRPPAPVPALEKGAAAEGLASLFDGARGRLGLGSGPLAGLNRAPDLRLIEKAAGASVMALRGQHAGWVRSASFSSDGGRVVTVGDDRKVVVWDARTGESLLAMVQTHYPTCAVFSPDGTMILVTSVGPTTLWDAATGGRISVLDTRGMAHVAFSPNGKSVIANGNNNDAILWNSRTGNMLKAFEGHGDIVTDVSLSPDGTRLLTASFDKTAIVWDLSTGEKKLTLDGHEGKLHFASFSADGTKIVTAGYDNMAIVWDARTGRPLHVIKEEHLLYAFLSPDGSKVVTNGKEGAVNIRDARTGKPLSVLADAKSGLPPPSFSPDGKRLATVRSNDTPVVWDVETGKMLQALEGGEAHAAFSIFSVSFSPDGAWLAIVGADSAARLWRVGWTPEDLGKIGAYLDGDASATPPAPAPGQTGSSARERFRVPLDAALIGGAWAPGAGRGPR